jgi:hypothetical protein
MPGVFLERLWRICVRVCVCVCVCVCVPPPPLNRSTFVFVLCSRVSNRLREVRAQDPPPPHPSARNYNQRKNAHKEEVTILRVVFHCTEFHREDDILHTCNKQRRRLVDNTMLDNAMAYRS